MVPPARPPPTTIRGVQTGADSKDAVWTVVIPTFQRPSSAARAARAAVAMSTPPGGFEIVMVDDGGGDDLGEARAAGPIVRITRKDNGGPASARNHGVREARGSKIAFLDDDCTPASDWLLAFDRALARHPGALVGGRTVNALKGSALSAASQDVVDWMYAEVNEPGGESRFFTSNNIALEKDVFVNHGGFDETFGLAGGEDRAFCAGLRSRGVPLAFTPEAVVEHRHALSLRSFWRQHVAYGRGSARFQDAGHAPEWRASGARARASRYGRALSWPLRSRVEGARVRRTAAIGLAQVATAVGRWRERRER